jgi:hypothetical protein
MKIPPGYPGGIFIKGGKYEKRLGGRSFWMEICYQNICAMSTQDVVPVHEKDH